jgi:galactokinase
MINQSIFDELSGKFKEHFGGSHAVAAYAPGRIEVLGNHTDYNDGFVVSAAIDVGTFFVAAPSDSAECRLVAGDLMDEVSFDVTSPGISENAIWSNYIRGVVSGLSQELDINKGFNGMFLGNIPLGSGLSSSAALEVSTGLALASLYDIALDPLVLAKIGQKAEHDYAGVKCGLLDQISSIFGEDNELIMTDFRSLEIKTLPIGDDACFLMCDTHAKHALVDGEYNERREMCETAATFFDQALDHGVAALRDVSWAEWEEHSAGLDSVVAKRAAHPIGENDRVLKGVELLEAGNVESFGELMFASHESSRTLFENSCPELDAVVSVCREIPGVLGARLSGGGFGGSVVVLVHARDAEVIAGAISSGCQKKHGLGCDVSTVRPSNGAQLIS